MHRKWSNGFTLLELMVVIVIITILAALLAISITWVIEKAKIDRTKGLIGRLENAVRNYAQELGEGYPPSSGTYSGSQNLHYYLCQQFEVPAGHSSDAPGFKKSVGPFLDISGADLDGDKPAYPPDDVKNIVDSWNNAINYSNPGQDHTAKGSNDGDIDTTKFVDIWSVGPDGDSATTDDNISNFSRGK